MSTFDFVLRSPASDATSQSTNVKDQPVIQQVNDNKPSFAQMLFSSNGNNEDSPLSVFRRADSDTFLSMKA